MIRGSTRTEYGDIGRIAQEDPGKDLRQDVFTVDWYGTEFNVLPRGTRGYEWVLRNNDISVCITQEAKEGKALPEVYVSFSVQFLWANGFQSI